MYLDRIHIRNFRNFEDETVELPREGAALIGPNGQGKTNFLEAIYYLEIFRSFRGARDEQLVSFGADFFRVEGHLTGGVRDEVVEVAAGYVRDGRRKKVTVNGGGSSAMAENIGRVGAIIFTASDVDMIAGAPGVRRRFLDIILSLVEPGYLTTLQRYRQILIQRNELLRARGDATALAAWNDGLVLEGSRILCARSRWVARAKAEFAKYYETFSGGECAAMEYCPSVSSLRSEGEVEPGEDEWADAFRQQLTSSVERELRRGMTLLGPHRDDLRFGMVSGTADVNLRTFGSAGQQRTAAIALRMVEADTLQNARACRPIVMLDDVFAELDPERSRRVIEMLSDLEWGQVIVTSPKPDEYALLGGRLREYRIEQGRIDSA